jgi:choline dehydrogenase-like flavoprotein
MIIDYYDAAAPQHYSCDICLIGSGAATLALLTKLYDTPYRIVVLEGGGGEVTAQQQELYYAATPHHPLSGAQEGRFRVFGGSTVKWGGQALPLDPADFTPRPWVPFSGWPISYEEVAQYYAEVDEFLKVEPHAYEADIHELLRERQLPDSKELKFRFSKWSPKPNLRETYRARLASSTTVTLVQHASLVAINMADNHSMVTSLTISSLAHKKGTVRAKRYVLACGGIENARLLLASNHQCSVGLGNGHDLVGRFFQDHPNAHVATLSNASSQAQRYFNYFFVRKTRCLPRFILTDKFQAEQQVLNASASLLFFPQENDAYTQILTLYRQQARGQLTWQNIQTLLGVGLRAHQLLRPAASLLLYKKVFTPNPVAKLNLMMETPPDPTNRVMLTPERDALGLPVVAVVWRLNEQVQHTLVSATQLFVDYFSKLNLGTLEPAEWVNTPDWTSHLQDAYHHIGTTRMGATSHEGVVDRDCRVFGVENLYVAGSSVFPTSGHSNPTATLLALAFRLADHLKASLC